MRDCLTAAVLLAAAAVVLWDRWRLRRTFRRMDEMLGAAIRGEFQEERFDESLLSAMETRLAHYLSSSAVTAGQMQEERDRIKTLIANISHQTKTPIANLRLYTQLLEEQSPESPYTAPLAAQTRRLEALIDALMKTSRLESGILTLHPRPAPLAPVLEEAAAQFLPRAAEKGLSLTLEPTGEQAVFDPKWTLEALCNLLDNAVKYTDSGGITVRVRPYTLFCRVDVTDTGPGTGEEEPEKLFQRFYRGSSAYETEGVGIGLYLVRQIAQGQGGYVKLFPQPGRGCTVSLFLPRE